MKKLFTLIFVLMLQLGLAAPALAYSFDFKETFNIFQESVTEQSETLEDGTQPLVIPTYQEDIIGGGSDGTYGFVNAMGTFLDFFKLIVAPLVIAFMVGMGIRMVTAGSDNEEVLNKSKNYISYAVQGLLVIFLADALVEVTFGPLGEVFRGGEAGAQEFGRKTGRLLEGIYSLAQVVIGSIAVLMLVSAGMRYIGASFSEDQTAAAKRQIQWALGGLFIIAISEYLAREILFQDQGRRLGINQAEALFAQVTNFIAGTMGTLSFVFLLYAGFLYVTARDNEDSVAKAKKIIMGAFIGLLLAAAAFALTTTLVELDASR